MSWPPRPRVRGDRDALGPGTDGQRAAGLAGGRVDPGNRAVLAVGDPRRRSLPTAIPSGSPPTGISRFVTSPVTGSIRSTVASPWLATQMPLGPLAMASGMLPTVIFCTTALAAALIRDTVPVAAVGDPYVAAGDGDRGRIDADPDLLHHGMGGRVDP